MKQHEVDTYSFTFLVTVSVFELHTSRQACFMILFVGAQIQTWFECFKLWLGCLPSQGEWEHPSGQPFLLPINISRWWWDGDHMKRKGPVCCIVLLMVMIGHNYTSTQTDRQTSGALMMATCRFIQMTLFCTLLKVSETETRMTHLAYTYRMVWIHWRVERNMSSRGSLMILPQEMDVGVWKSAFAGLRHS